MLEATELTPAVVKPKESSVYIVQFDGIRALAIAAVLADHLSDGAIVRVMPLGLMGVRLFFVLSGFLITGILLKTRDAAEAGMHSKNYGLKHFYIRRFLRIFPIYYLTIAVTCLLAWPIVAHNLIWHLTYTTNIFVARLGEWPPLVGHFWSLAVEEQFYLIWPWLILFCPRRALLLTIIVVACIGPLFRFFSVLAGVNQLAVFVSTPSALDSLGIGALLVLCNRNADLRQIKDRYIGVAFWGAVAGLIALILLQKTGHAAVPRKVLWYALVSVAAGGIIDRAASGFKGFGKWLLENPVSVWIGKVSYGVYLYHPLVNDIVERFTRGMPHSTSFKFALIALKLAAVFGIAAISWIAIEKPLNGLKLYFSY